MNELSEIRSKISGIDHSIKLLQMELEKLENALTRKCTDSKEVYLRKYDINFRKFTKGVARSKKPNKDIKVNRDHMSIEEIGRSGEVAYNNYLREILDLEFCTITWMNQVEESSKSFDFLVKIGRATFYVDVKTTRGNQNNKLYLSKPELRFAKSRKPNYFVARLSLWDELKRYRADVYNVKMLHLDKAIELTK